MSIFTLIAASVVALTHAYLFWSLRRVLGGGYWQWAFLAVFAFMLCLTLLRRGMAARSEWLFLFDFYNYWLAFLVVGTVGFLAVDLLRLVLLLVDLAAGSGLRHALAPARAGKFTLLFCLALYAYSLYEARAVRVVRLKIASDRPNPERSSLRVAALADIHLGRLVGPKDLEKMLRLVEAENPDLTVLLGDVVDSDMTGKNRERELLRELPGRLGKFAVLGNHEVFGGISHAVDFLEDSGFAVLRGAFAEAGGIVVAGVDDPYTRFRFDAAETLRDAPMDKFVLLLNHRPIVTDQALGRFDLQLSGHTHGGQIFPGHFFAAWFNGRRPGLSEFPVPADGGKKSSLFLTTGAGFWGPPARLFAPPEIVVVDIVFP